MSRKPLPANIPPRLLTEDQAAAYCGMTGPTFAKLVTSGLMPRPTPFQDASGGRVVECVRWDIRALDLCLDRLSGLAPWPAEIPDAPAGDPDARHRTALAQAIDRRKLARGAA